MTTFNPFTIALYNNYSNIDENCIYYQVSGSFYNIKKFLESPIKINNLEIVYASCINFIEEVLGLEMSEKKTMMFKNINGNLKFNYKGNLDEMIKIFKEFNLK